MHYPACLTVNDIRLHARLGFEAWERAQTQPVRLDIRLYFPPHIAPGLTDGENFTCYDHLARTVQTMCESSEFQLIEHVARRAFAVLRSLIGSDDIKLWLCLTKLHPPVDIIHGGASFTMTDLPPGATLPPQ